MRKNFLPWAALLLLAVVAVFACQKEYRPGFALDPVNPPAENVKATISGRVVNENQQPVEGALVTAGNLTGTTNHQGYFNLENATVNADAAFVRVNMLGYFLGSRTIMAQENGAHYVQIELIPIKKTGEFAASTGGTVSFPAGGSAIFPANAIVRESDGSAYTGRVDVSQFFIDPTTTGFTDKMPGDLKGINSANRVVAMQSFGMMAIQLNGEGGELLQVAPGKMVDLHFPIPASLTAKAPATIPLWFFDEEKGLWREEGGATKTGSEYVGQVSHFSFWNADVPIDFTEISLTIKDMSGNPQANVYVEIKKKSDNTLASSYSDALGRLKGWIPANEALELSIYNSCREPIHKRDIGPYSSPVDLGVFNVEAGSLAWFGIHLYALNCYSTYILNGYVNVYFHGTNRRFELDSSNRGLYMAIPDCHIAPDSVKITVYDADTDTYATQTIWMEPDTEVDLGKFHACDGELGEFLRFRIDGKKYEFLIPADSVMFVPGTDHNIYGYRSTTGMSGSVRFPSSVEGPYNTIIKDLKLKGNSLNYFARSGNLKVIKYGAVNDFIEAEFNGTINDSLSGQTDIPLTGGFRVKRRF